MKQRGRFNAATRRFHSPLRYPGGKGKVANFIKLLILENDLLGGEYVEPYAGGAGVALGLLFEGYVDQIHINDLDPAVHAFWKAAIDHTDDLCRLVRDTSVTVEEWQRQRDVQADDEAGGVELAFSTLFMNRTNRSGIIRGGGIIGGRQQNGPFKIDARYDVEDLVRRIEKVGRFRSRITLTNEDALDLLRPWCLPGAPDGLIYLDPPYVRKGGGLYRNAYEVQDHIDVASLVDTLRVPWIVSYDAHASILDLYSSKPSLRYSLSYSAGPRGQGSEVMFFREGLLVPEVDSPASVQTEFVDRRMAETVVR